MLISAFTGPAPDAVKPLYQELGLSGAIAMSFVEHLPKDAAGVYLPFHIFADNYFTSLKLLQHLSSLGVGCTRTVPTNRTGRCPFDDWLKKSPPGSFILFHERSSKVVVSQWHDNNIVTMVSTCFGVQPL